MESIIRIAEKRDVPYMLALIKELAAYEKAPLEVTNTIERMEADGFSGHPSFFAHVAELEGAIVGVAIYYKAYSTWKGNYIYLDDIIITAEMRGKGIGKKLFDAVGAFAKDCNANLLRWHVLEWNEPAINFYKKYDATLDPEWITCKLKKEQLESLF
ncbi:MAG: GNAT family N-acetyltransferase [Chitinophagaceae bacterium]|nr:GNAT family N-acetyltransferase [Chitinophagaceae bacterium]